MDQVCGRGAAADGGTPSLSHRKAQWWSGREDPSWGPTSARVRPIPVTHSDWSPTCARGVCRCCTLAARAGGCLDRSGCTCDLAVSSRGHFSKRAGGMQAASADSGHAIPMTYCSYRQAQTSQCGQCWHGDAAGRWVRGMGSPTSSQLSSPVHLFLSLGTSFGQQPLLARGAASARGVHQRWKASDYSLWGGCPGRSKFRWMHAYILHGFTISYGPLSKRVNEPDCIDRIDESESRCQRKSGDTIRRSKLS